MRKRCRRFFEGNGGVDGLLPGRASLDSKVFSNYKNMRNIKQIKNLKGKRVLVKE